MLAIWTDARDEVKSITTTGAPAGGSFILGFRGTSTSAIVYNATSAQVKTALEVATGSSTITAAGGPLPTAVTVTFGGKHAGKNVDSLTLVTNSLTGGSSPAPAVTTTTTTTGGKGRLPITYNGLVLNNWSDSPNDTYDVDTVAPATQFDWVSEVNQQKDGLEVYEARKVSRMVEIKGTIRATTYAKLYEKMKDLAAAFDPAKVSYNNPATSGFLAMDGYTPTTDTTNYTGTDATVGTIVGLVPSRYYARPLKMPEPVIARQQPYDAFFAIPMLLRDPRRYLTSTSSQAGAGTITNIGDYRSWPSIVLTRTGVLGSATYNIQNVNSMGTHSITLDVSNAKIGTAWTTVTVDVESRNIDMDGVDTNKIYVTDTSTASAYGLDGWFEILPGSNIITITNGTSTTTAVVYRRAFCL